LASAHASARRLRVAVVGLGKMGIMHTAMVRACPRAELVALGDRQQALVNHVRSMGADVRGYDDVAKLLAEAKPEAVVLATPQFTHRALVQQCLEAGCHVLVEKPLAHTLDDARAALACGARFPDRVVHVAFMKGHDPLFRRAAALLRTGALGEVCGTADATAGVLGSLRGFQASVHLGQVFKAPKGWTFQKEKSGGGVLINTGVHLLFLMRLFFGPLRRVACLASPVHGTTEDTLSALAEHQPWPGQRVAGSVHVSWSSAGHDTEDTSLVVEGTHGTLYLDDHSIRLWLSQAQGEYPRGWTEIARASVEAPATTFSLTPDYAGEAYFREVERFVGACLGEAQDPADTFGLAPAFQIQAMADAYYRSAELEGAWAEPAAK